MADIGSLTQEIARGAGVPYDATPFASYNATAVALIATPQTVRAAVTGKKKWIRSCFAVNATTGEDVLISLQDSADTAYAIMVPQDIDATTSGSATQIFFDPPVEIPAGLAVEALASADLGDSYLNVTGWEEK